MSTSLVLGLASCYALQAYVVGYLEKHYDAYLALSGYGMKSGHLWELLTYQCFHKGIAHLLINIAALLTIGRAVEYRLGPWRFLLIYQAAVLAGGILQGVAGVAGFWLPESIESIAAYFRNQYGGAVSGASVGVWGILAAYCILSREHTLKWLFLLSAVVVAIVPGDPDMANLAHLGGFLAGMAVMRRWEPNYR